MMTQIDEKIKVGAVFACPEGRPANRGYDQKLKPVWFFWSGKKYPIKEITFSWKDRKGESDLYFFSVTDGQAVYEISYNDKSLVWMLEKVYVEAR